MGLYLFFKHNILVPLIKITKLDKIIEPLPFRLFELQLASFFGNPTSERIIEHPWTINWMKKNSRGKILDIGCGYRANKNATVIADIQDLSSFYKGKNFIRIVEKKLPFKDKEFDFVIASHVQ